MFGLVTGLLGGGGGGGGGGMFSGGTAESGGQVGDGGASGGGGFVNNASWQPFAPTAAQSVTSHLPVLALACAGVLIVVILSRK